ncbi:hypothetical protein ABZ153_07075 [Streptomyces sp. NPDC006290]|uniref:hypothetical protein n=1 Tax=Streptomyces sp. NPDC006290 TaxID=3156745 RepID=UPI0033BFB5AF
MPSSEGAPDAPSTVVSVTGSAAYGKNDHIDHGIATAFAAVAGLVGAGVGGLATAYGARVGAEKTMEAARIQVEHQSSSEHRHWVREQRKQACSDFVDAYGSFAIAVNNIMDKVNEGDPPSESDLDSARAELRKLIIIGGRMQLWGPDELVSHAKQLREAAEQFEYTAHRWPNVLATNDPSELSDHHDRFRAAGDSARLAREALALAARRILAAAH